MSKDIKQFTPIPASRLEETPEELVLRDVRDIIQGFEAPEPTVTYEQLIRTVYQLQEKGMITHLAMIYRAYLTRELKGPGSAVENIRTVEENLDCICGAVDALPEKRGFYKASLEFAVDNPHVVGPVREYFRKVTGYSP
ncbi:TPA: hypothetical protein HA265_05455 [Candidatus Woesearchaeota archaeon]|nr:hypothetical protein [Candidatus Woesearchaeota archaeon]